MGKIWIPGGGGGIDLDVTTATAGDILSGKVIVGPDGEPLTGTLALSGTANDSNVLSGKTYYNTDAKTVRTGTMIDQGAKTSSLNCGDSYTIPSGYHNGSGKITANSLASQTSATAAAGDIESGKTAWVNGSKITGTLALSGDAADGNVLSGKTYYNNALKTKRTGTMANQGKKDSSLNCGGSYTIPEGYHNGQGTITANSLASQTGVQSGKTAAGAGQILTGYEAWVNGGRVTGTMANQGAATSSLNCGGSYTIPAGYHNGSGKVTANSLASQTSATAAAGDIESGKTAWVNGSKVTGTMATLAGGTYTPTTSQQTISCSGKKMTSNIVINAIPNNSIAYQYTSYTGSSKIYDFTTQILATYRTVTVNVPIVAGTANNVGWCVFKIRIKKSNGVIGTHYDNILIKKDSNERYEFTGNNGYTIYVSLGVQSNKLNLGFLWSDGPSGGSSSETIEVYFLGGFTKLYQ